MHALALYKLSGKSGLLIRETADQALSKLDSGFLEGDSPIEIDFSGVLAVSPSFMDQLIRGLRQMLSPDSARTMSFHLHRVPTQASEKFAAVGRAHGLALREITEGEWVLTPRPKP